MHVDGMSTSKRTASAARQSAFEARQARRAKLTKYGTIGVALVAIVPLVGTLIGPAF